VHAFFEAIQAPTRDSAIAPNHTVLIYNPVAGRLRGRGRARLEQAVKSLEQHGYRISVTPTTGPGIAGELARQAIERGAGLILAAGGDGTLNEVLQGMVNSEIPLGILPAGTANVLATEIGIGKDLNRAANGLAECVPRRIGLGRLDFPGASRHYVCMAGVGFDAHIVYNLKVSLKNSLGKVAYWVSGLSQAARLLPQFEVEIDGARHTCSFALISRVRNYGGDFTIARNVTLFDDRFEVVLFEGCSSLRYVKYFLGLALNRVAGMKGVTVLNATRVAASAPDDSRVYVQIDGEYAGHLPAEIEIVPDALTLMVSEDYGRKGR
jgi:YegS/Rv2252/BmrU family lipid kinase